MHAMKKSTRSWITLLALVSQIGTALAVEVNFRRIADGVYAHVGEKGARTAENEGLNANIGLVVTPDGAVLIDSGATTQSARQIHEAVRRITMQPVRWVINTGGQDHRWLGNHYFKTQGAEIIAHANGRMDMEQRGQEHVQALQSVLGDKAADTQPSLPTRWLTGRDEDIVLGGLRFAFKHRGGGHTPGDTVVWLPERSVLFSGDIVYVDRLLGVIQVSHTGRWLETFSVIEQLRPRTLVPGHGNVTDLATAQADTRNYLQALRHHMQQAVEAGTDISTATRTFNAAPFMRLLNAAELMPGNASRTYLELERE